MLVTTYSNKVILLKEIFLKRLLVKEKLFLFQNIFKYYLDSIELYLVFQKPK